MYTLKKLDNGLNLITSDMPHVRSVSLTFFIGAGGCFESREEAGLSHFIEHLCFKGTPKHPTSRDISEAIERTGGTINGGTDKELTMFWCKVASQHTALAIDVLSDIVRNSRFEPDDIERERKVIIEEINMTYDSPQQRVDMLIYELLWPGQPLGRDIAGEKETVQGFNRQNLLKFFHRHYLPGNIVVSIAGDLKTAKIDETFREVFKDWHQARQFEKLKSVNEQKAPRLKVEFRDTEQVNICLGIHGFSLLDPDRFAIDILNIILGEGMSSRLFVEMREKRGLAYEIGSSADHFTDDGDLIVHAGVEPRQTETALKVMIEQLATLKDKIVEEELESAKELIKGRIFLALENTRSVAYWLGAQQTLTGKIMDIDEVTALVDAVTLGDLKRVANQLIVGSQLNLAVVGPVKNGDSLHKLLKV